MNTNRAGPPSTLNSLIFIYLTMHATFITHSYLANKLNYFKNFIKKPIFKIKHVYLLCLELLGFQLFLKCNVEHLQTFKILHL